jgi:hypothetical protein
MILFRKHFSVLEAIKNRDAVPLTLEDSLATTVELESWSALIDYVVEYVKPLREIKAEDVRLKFNGFDTLTNLNTTLVEVRDFGVVGFVGEPKYL